MDLVRMLEDSYVVESDSMSRLEWLSEYVFKFTTYDSEIAEEFARRALEVCGVISERTSFEFIKDSDNYRWYILMCNMPFFSDKLEWGTSIRGAWWSSGIGIHSLGFYDEGIQIMDSVEFDDDEWVDFVSTMIDFAKEG